MQYRVVVDRIAMMPSADIANVTAPEVMLLLQRFIRHRYEACNHGYCSTKPEISHDPQVNRPNNKTIPQIPTKQQNNKNNNEQNNKIKSEKFQSNNFLYKPLLTHHLHARSTKQI